MWELFLQNWNVVALAFLAFASEVIGLNPAWKSSSIVEMLMAGAKKLIELFKPKQ